MSSEHRKIIKLLRVNGWILARTKGDHSIFKHHTRPDRISVPADSPSRNHRVYTSIKCQILNGTKALRSGMLDGHRGLA